MEGSHPPLEAAPETVEARRQLEALGLPAPEWTRAPEGMLDVAIVGAGMCGIAAAGALSFRGVRNIRLFDRNPRGSEGPWRTYARMETLRSPKTLPGPALGVAGLSFPAWRRARGGEAAWDALYKIPNGEWQDYLDWLRATLELPVTNEATLRALEPQGDHLALTVEGPGGAETVRARRVVLATGRAGAGGAFAPEGVERGLWPDLAAHSSEAIDFARLRGARLAVMGGGASAWDNAATALERGAASVDLYVRRRALPQVNYGRGSAHPGWFIGWHALPDAEKWRLVCWLRAQDSPPPHETVHRTLRHPNFRAHLGAPVLEARRSGEGVRLTIGGREPAEHDFLIVGTGFGIDLRRVPELAPLSAHVALWRDRLPPEEGARDLARFPYLGGGFELLPRGPEAPAGLDRIHLFNHGAFASHGPVASDIPGINVGAGRLADAIAAALFVEEFPAQRAALEAFAEPELETTPFFDAARFGVQD